MKVSLAALQAMAAATMGKGGRGGKGAKGEGGGTTFADQWSTSSTGQRSSKWSQVALLPRHQCVFYEFINSK
jgi:hypothetical protein